MSALVQINVLLLQGDQIGRIFAYLALKNLTLNLNLKFKKVNFGQLLKITVKSPIFPGTFPHGKSNLLIMIKNGLGFTLGDFFANSSGHPVICCH
jgi:hypothetical protein